MNYGDITKPSLVFESVYNTNTLNIFCDASVKPKIELSCYGAVALCQDVPVDIELRFSSKSNSTIGEAKAFREATRLVNRYKNQFQYINIFSDSLETVKAIRYKSFIISNKYKQIQSILLESISNLDASLENRLSIYHQRGHIDNSMESILTAGYDFLKFNNMIGTIDMNLIRYISMYNSYIDQATRGQLIHRLYSSNSFYTDPVIFNNLNKL
jgi:ribonuclease HI